MWEPGQGWGRLGAPRFFDSVRRPVIAVCAAVLVAGALGIGPAGATETSPFDATTEETDYGEGKGGTGGLQPGDPSFLRVLSEADRITYMRIFDVQADGDWATADRLMQKVESPILMGHALFQRYMHPTAYRSSYTELSRWLARYGDHPEAARIYKLALRRKPASAAPPRAPARKAWRFAKRERTAFEVYNARRSDAQRRKARQIESRVRSLLRRERPTQALGEINNPDNRRHLTPVEFDRLRSWIARSYYMEQVDEKALRLASDVAASNRKAVPLADWTAGLAAWRMGEISLAAEHFAAVAKAPHLGEWERAGGAYWAARAYLQIREPRHVIPMLRIAAEAPLSFYGLLARRQLGLPLLENWSIPALTAGDFDRLARDSGVRRAVALADLGRTQAAEKELSWAHGRLSDADDSALLALAHRLSLPHTQLKVALSTEARGLEAGLFPVPAYVPEGGFKVDRALLFAIMRKESKFLTQAKSHVGARGLMQVMPATAQYLRKDGGYLGAGRNRLFNPAHNIALGQDYAVRLMDMMEPKGNLLMALSAYNAGPGNLRRWIGSIRFQNDPLLFVESIPLQETRNYVERVAASFWLYRASLGQPTPSLDMLAAAQWPIYQSIETPGATPRIASRADR